MNDYARGWWVPGVAFKGSMPVARITRKRPTGRGDEIHRCAHRHTTRREAMRCAVDWAARENGVGQ